MILRKLKAGFYKKLVKNNLKNMILDKLRADLYKKLVKNIIK
jgi:hypothetical protein